MDQINQGLALVGMLALMVVLVARVKFAEIRYSGHKNYDVIVNRPSMFTFNHRGKTVWPRLAKV